jgi:hypothetical protein
VIRSAIVTCAITLITAGASIPVSCRAGSSTAADPEASSTTYIAAWPVPAMRAASKPAGIARTQTMPASSPPLLSAAVSRLSRSGKCMPTVSISIAKPISARNEIEPFAGLTASSTVGPTRMPARISPMTTGTKRRPAIPSSGPPRPASMITTSVPKLTGTPFQLCASGAQASGPPPPAGVQDARIFDAPGWIRTSDPRIRRRAVAPA